MSGVIENIRGIIDIYGSSLPVGFLIALSCSVFGVFVILKRVVFIGITLAETAACGVALGLLTGWNPLPAAVLLSMIVVCSLALPFDKWRIPRDAVLGSIFTITGSLSILLVSQSGFGLEKVKAILYGNLLLTDNHDLMTVLFLMLPCLAILLAARRPVFYSFLDADCSRTLGMKPGLIELLFFMGLGLVVSAASKVAGVNLVFCYLVVPPVSALVLFRRFNLVLLFSSLFALGATALGVYGSYVYDLPPNQTISVAACSIFILTALIPLLRQYLNRRKSRFDE